MKRKPRRRAPGQRTPLVGWRERVSLPALGLNGIRAKVDTGARTSAIHALEIRRFRRGGRRMVRFKLLPKGKRRKSAPPLEAEATLWGERKVRSSSGHPTLRPIILTVLALGGERWVIELGLASRALMGFPMLLGRQALRGRLLVDPGRSYLAGASGGGTGARAVRRKGTPR
ncbi:MAG: ATP-dependent zinc protease family protein [Planctomycetaceae bacterium]